MNEHKGYGPDFTAYPDMVNIADTLFYRSSNKEYEQGGNLRALEKSGENTHFDLGRIETWPGFEKLPEAIDPANPEAGTQEYYLQRFELGKSDTYPSTDEMPFIKVMTGYTHPEGYQIPGYLVSMESQAGLPYDQSLGLVKVSDNTGSSDLVWRDGTTEFLVTTENVAPYEVGAPNGFAATYPVYVPAGGPHHLNEAGKLLVAYAVQDAGQWNATIKLFDPETGVELSSVTRGQFIDAPVMAGDQIMVNLTKVGSNQFAVNLAKFDEAGTFSQLKFMTVDVQSDGSLQGFATQAKSTDLGFPELFPSMVRRLTFLRALR